MFSNWENQLEAIDKKIRRKKIMDTMFKKPPMEKSNEAKLEQLEMAREQGKTYVNALKGNE